MPDLGLILTDGVVVLRPWRLTDADWYAKAVGDPEIQRFTREPPQLTTAEVQDAIVALADQPEVVGWCICDAATGQRSGNIALRHDATGGSLAYWVAASARGRGVATRALRLVSDWAVAALALPVLRLWTHADNLASRRVAERAGYQRAPGDDQQRTVKGQVWETVGYRRAAKGLASDSSRAAH